MHRQARTLLLRAHAAVTPSSTYSCTRHGMNRMLIRYLSTTAESIDQPSQSTNSTSTTARPLDTQTIQHRFDKARRHGFRRKFEDTNSDSNNNNSSSGNLGHRRRRQPSREDEESRTAPPRYFYPASPNPDLHPTLYRVFFRSLDNIRTLEEAQVFISHIKNTYGPLLQYQFSRCPETKRYLGYGFMTFRDKTAMDNLLRDGYLRVMQKDFEFQRCGMLEKPVLHHNPSGFSGFKSSGATTTTTTSEHLATEKYATTAGTAAQAAPSRVETNDQETSPSSSTFHSITESISPTANDTETAASVASPTQTSSSTSSTRESSPGEAGATAVPPLRQRVQLWKAAPNQKPVQE